MDVTSIDNCYEDDGLTLVTGFLMGLNLEAQHTPTDPLRRVLIAVLPEFRADGRLDRLNFLTAPATDPGLLHDEDIALMDAAAVIVARLQKARAEAYARVTVPTVKTDDDQTGD